MLPVCLIHDSNEIVSLLTQQLTMPVRWREAMLYLQEQGIEVAVEIGPKSVLRNLLKANAPLIKAFSYDKSERSAGIEKRTFK